MDENDPEGARKCYMCDTLFMCLVYVLDYGMLNGGGIGDVLYSSYRLVLLLEVFYTLLVVQAGKDFLVRIIYDVSFWAILSITVINLIFGVIIDTFGDLRAERQAAEERLNNTCFICALEREKYAHCTHLC